MENSLTRYLSMTFTFFHQVYVKLQDLTLFLLFLNRIAARLWAVIILFILFVGINQAQAAITLVKNIGATAVKGAHTQLQVTVPAAGVAAGNTVIIAIALDYSSSNTPPIPSCSDSKGNTYTLDVEHNQGNFMQGAICSAPVTTALVSGDTITVTHASLIATAMSANEFSGLLTSGALDKTAKSAGIATTTPNSTATATTTQADELLFGTVSIEDPPTITFTAGAGFTALTGAGTTGSGGNTNMTVYPEYGIVTSTGAYSAAGTLSAASNWIAAIATYKAAVDLCPGNVVTTTADTGSGSLRECINKANLFPGTTISFNIPGPGNQSSGADSWWRITPLGWLPGISAANTIIDATTQTTNQGNINTLGPEIELYGASAGAGGLDGFGVISPASNVTIKGFIINGWSGAGISLWTGTGSNTVTGNYLGTNYAGTAAGFGNQYGVYVNTDNNTIGGTTAAARNIISGNTSDGIRVVGTGNVIQGNYIGIDRTGSGALGNTAYGINIVAGATGSSIGGTAAGAGNVISGNTSDGINHSASGSNNVYGNYIGTNASSASLPNGGNGISTSAGTINLGNASESQSNIIGPNTGVGINLAGGTLNLAGTVTVNDDITLTTGTFNGGTGTIDINGALSISGGSFTATSGTTFISGNLTISGGTFNHNSGSTTLDGGAMTVNIGTAVLNHVTINKTGTMTVSGDMQINGNLTFTAATNINAGDILVAGDVTTNDVQVQGSAGLYFIGSGNQTLSAPGVSGAVPSVFIIKPSGTLFLQGTIEVDGSRGWGYTSGTVNAGTSTVVFDYWSKTISSVGMSFNHVNISLSAGTVDLTVNNTMDINGDLTIISVNNINIGTGLGLITVAGNVTTTDATIGGTALITLDGTGAQTITASGGADLPNGTLTINKASGTATLASNLTLNSAGQDLTVASGTLDLAGFNVTLTGAGDVLTIDTNGTLRLQGGETITATTKTFNAGSAVIYGGGSGSYSFTPLGAYHHLIFNDSDSSWSHSSALDVNGDLTIISGTLVSGGQNVNVAGNWSNSGTYTNGSNTVILDGTNQTITGSTTFNILSKTESTNDATDAILTFDNTATQTINGTLTLDGLDGDDRINLVSNSPGTQWSLVLGASAAKAIDYVDVQDSDASGSAAGLKPISPVNSISSGNNFAWFPAVVSGTVYTDEGTTTIADGATVRLLVNGTDRGNTTTVGGAYTITPSVTLVAGDALLVYIDNHATDGVAVTVASGNDISGFNIYGGHLITRHDNSGTLTNANMATAKGGSGDTDIIYSVDGSNNLTVSGSGTELYLWSGHSYTPGANVTTPALESLGAFNGGTGIIDINGVLTIAGGSFTASSGTTSIAGDFTLSAGSFNHNAGSITLDGSGSRSVAIGATLLNNVTLNSSTLNVTGTMDVDGNLLITSIDNINGTIAVAGNVTTTDLGIGGSGVILFDGTSNQLLSAGGGTGSVPGVVVNKGGGTLTLQDTLNLTGSGGWSYTAGTVNAGTSTVVVTASQTINSGAMSFNNTTLSMSGSGTLTVTGTMDVNGNLVITNIDNINGGTIAVAGNVTTTDLGIGGSGVILLDGGSGQTLGASGGTGSVPAVAINKGGGTLTLQDTLRLSGTSGWSYTAGTVDAGSSTVVVTVSLTVNSGVMAFNNVTLDMNTSGSLTVTGTMDVNGNLTITKIDNIIGGTIAVASDLISTDTGLSGTTNITLDGTATQTITTGTGDLPNGTLAINKTSGTASLAANLTLNGAGQDLHVIQGTLDFAGFNGSIPDSFVIAATGIVQLRGSEIVTVSGTFAPLTGSTVIYNGGGNYTGLPLGNVYSNLSFNNAAGTWTLNASLVAFENITISTGVLDVSSSNHTVTLGGHWSNSGTFTARSGTVTFNGTAQSITGNTIFNNFTKSVTSAATLTFAASSTTTINGLATLNGAAGQLLSLRSSSAPTRWNLNLAGTKTISSVDVQDSDASGSIAGNKPVAPTNSTNSGNTIAWFAGTFNGVVYSDQGVTPVAAGKTIRLLVNGVSAGTTTTDGSGGYALTSAIGLNAGDAVLAYIDMGGGAEPQATTASVTNGAGFSGFDLYGNTLITRYDNGAGNLTNTHLSSAKGAYVDTDILYALSGANLTVSGASTELHVPSGHSYAPGGDVTTPNLENLGTFNGGTGTIDINGALVVSGGSFTATSSTSFISGDFTISAGTFAHNAGLITLDGGAMTATIGTAVLNHVTINKTGTMTVSGDMQINGNLTFTAATNINAGDILVAGDVTTNDVQVQGSAGLYFIGSGNQILSAPGVSGAVPSVFIIKPSGTLFLQGTIEVDGSRGWGYTSGTVNAGTSTVVFDYWSKTIAAAGMSFNHVAIQLSAGTVDLTVNDTLDINGNLTLTSVNNINRGTGAGLITVAGNITTSDIGVGGTALITLDGSGAQTISTGGTGDLPDGTLTINKASGMATLIGNLTLNAAGQDMTITAGTLDLAGYNLTLTGAGDVLTVDIAGTLQLQGGETVTASTKTFNAGSTVIYNGSGTYASLVLGNSYHHLTFNGAGTWMHGGALDVNGNLTLSAGTLISGGQNVNVAGNWSNAGIYTSGANTVTLDGSNQTFSGSTSFYNLSKIETTNDTTNSILTFDNTATQTITGTLTLDGLDADDRINLVSNSPGTQWSLVLGVAAVKALDYVDVQDSDASGSAAALKPVNPANAINSGNNIDWFAVTISGTVYQSDRTTVLSGVMVTLFVNGITTATTTSDGSGNYTFSTPLMAGDRVLLFIDNNVTYKGATVTVANGAALSGLPIYASHLTTRHDNSGALSNTDLAAAKGGGDTDIQYSVAGAALTVTSGTLYLPGGQSYTPGGDITTPSMESRGTFNGGSGIIDINGPLVMGSGNFTATSGTTNVAGHFTISGGSFAHNSGILTLDGTTKTVNIGSAVLNTVIVNMQDEFSDVFVTGTMDVNGNLTLSRVGGLLSGTIAVAGHVTTTDTTVSGSATILFDGVGAQAFGASGGTGGVPSISINKSGGTLSLSDTLVVYSDWTHSLGSVSTGTSTVRFEGGTKTINSGSMAFNHVIFNTLDEFRDITVTGTMDINGDFTITRVNNVVGGTLAIAGNLTSSDANVSDSAQITLDGTGIQNINVTGDLPDGIFTVNKASGTAVLLANFTTALDGASQDLTLAQGTLDLNGFNLTIPRILIIAANGILQLEGGESISIPTRAFDVGSTVLYDGGGSYTGLRMGSLYYNLRFNNAAGAWTLSSPLSVLQNLTITDGTLDVSTGNHQVNVGRDWTNSGTFIPRSGTVVFNGNTTNQNITGSTTFNNFSKTDSTNDASDSILIFDNTATQTINGLLILDGLDADDRINLVSNSPGNQWSLVLGASASKAIDFVDVRDSDAAGSAPALIPVNPVNSIDSGGNIQWFATAVAATSTLVEISPNLVAVGSMGNAFTYDLLPTIGGSDTGIDQVAVTAPSGYVNLSVTAVSVGGTNQTPGASCPALGGGEYCAVTAGQRMTITLGGKVTTTLTNIRIAFTTDAPGTAGSADFTSTIDDRGTVIAAQAATVGNADGDGTDNNSITVQVIGRAVTSVSAEISPNAVPISSISNIYTYHMLPSIGGGDTGLNQVVITAPAGHGNLSITGVRLGGIAQTAGVGCPAPGGGEYCVNVAGQVMTLTFGTPVTTSLTPIQLTFSADAPSTVGLGDFTAVVDDTATLTAAQTASAGNADGDAGDANSMTVATGDLAATSALAEISPNTVVMNTSAAAFIFDFLPTVNAADTGIDQIVLTAPAGFANLNVTGMSIGGTNQAAVCPVTAPGEYCSSVSGQGVTLSLGNKVMASLTNIQVRFSADVPGTAGNVNFTATFNDTATAVVSPQTTLEGNADQDPGDANTLSVVVRAVDAGQSSILATPSLVEIDYNYDGNPSSLIVIVPRDPAGANLGSNLNVVVSALETAPPSGLPSGLNRAPGDPFGVFTAVVDHGDGTYSTRLSSAIAGIATLAITVNGVPLQSLQAVIFTAGQVLKINKTANKKSGVVGDVITYEVEVQNTASLDISSVTLNDRIPAGFKYLRGSTLMNAQPASDPSGHQTLAFNLGTIAAWNDQNGNGLADAGDLGNLTLSYQLVIGSGVKPGDHVNRAQAVDFAPISNEAEAKVRVTYDPVFDLGTLIGKVFFDKNKNGWQDAGEAGVSGAMIALDNGTYVLTDRNGLYHFPGVLPGQRLLKINVSTLPPGTTITTEESRIVEVSRGLLTKVNFGVVYDIESEHIGQPGKQGAALSKASELEPARITGYLESMQLLVNGSDVDIPLNDVHLSLEDFEETVDVVGEKLSKPMSFSILLNTPEAVKSWRLDVFDTDGRVFKTLNAAGAPPETILWDGKNDRQELVAGGGIYAYQVEISYEDGGRETSSRRLFGVNRTSAISLNLLGSAFSVGSAQINVKTEKILHELAEVLKKHPDEKITIEGHTDDTGTETLNLNLSRQRAEAAMDYLVEKEGIDRNRFALKWFGESRPVMSNTLPEGREVNRRVEIVGSLKEVKKATILNHPRSETVVVVNSLPMQADDAGRFSMVLPEDTKTLVFELSNPQGQRVQTTLSFPSVDILSPGPNEVLIFGQRTDRYLAIPFKGLGPRSLDLPVVSYRIEGKTEADNLVWMDGKGVKVSPQGRFENDLLLKIGENIFTIVVSNPQRVSRMMTLKLHLSDKDDQGRLFMAIKPIPQVSVLLPPKEKVLSHTQLPLRGMTDRGNRLWVNQKEILVEENGTFSTTAELLEGRNTLVIEAVDPDGYTSRIEREVIVEKAPFFLMALADSEFGQMKTSGRLEGAGADEATEYYSKGRLAYYLKGRILGKYLITSAFDTGKNEFDRMFNDLDQKETDRFFTNIDPDKFYPVYGDESTVVYDVQSQGKFYLAIDGEDLNVLVGNYQTQLNDTELGAFNRTLHGGRFEYRSLSKTQYGAHDTKVVLFGAAVRLSHGQNTFHATGGSLYYLSEKNIVEGSEQVRLEVRDQDTGLLLAKIDQVRDADYSFKYEEGRILFRRPISSRISNDLLLRQVSLQGHPVFVLVDFEYEAQGFDKKAVGGRLRQQLGDHLAVGGTAIQDAADTGDYELTATDAEIRLGERTILAFEYAESAGLNSTRLISEDGGLSFIPIAAASAGEGDAYKLAVRSDLSEWFGAKERLVGNAYYKELSPEFFSNGTLLEQGTLKYGGGLKTVLNERNVLHFRYDVQEVISNANPVSANQVGAAQVIVKEIQYDHRRGPLLFTAGFQDKRMDDTKNGEEAEQQLAGRVEWRVNERISTSLGHQQLIRGEERYRTAAGLKVRLAEWLDTVAEGAHANDRHTALMGFSARIDDRSTLYTNETLEKKQGEAATWGSVAGGDRMLTQRLRLYGEYGEQRGNVDQSRSLWGLDQRFWDDKALKINLNYERSHLKGVSLNTTRDAAGVGLRYLRPDGSRSAHRFEVRLEKGADKKIQRLTTHYGELKLFSGLTLFGKFNFSDTKNRSQGRLEARFTEAGSGFAYRPIVFDALNVITKYTFLMDQKPATNGPMLKTEVQVISMEAIYDLSRYVQWVEKYAVKIKEETQSPRPRLKSQTDLWINRLNFHITQSLDLAGEYRILKQSLANDQLEGYAVEINRAVAKHFRFGVGYNFSRFTDNEFSDNNYDARGWFIRAQGKY